jgi:LDH2 family malate/lactate/ureidoglycolate dehydrogenase
MSAHFPEEVPMAVPAERLAAFVSTVLERVGVPPAEARTVADTLVDADLRGVHSHGVMRLPNYVDRIEAGLVSPKATPTVDEEGPAFARMNAHGGLGQVASVAAMDLAVRKARESGVGAVGVAHSTHFGAAAYYVLRATSAQMVGIAITNTLPLMPPVGGAAPVVGNNPIACGIPAGRHRPVVLDIATSVVARGRIQRAQGRGERIPLGWGVDRDGRPTEDPGAVMNGGMLLPVGGHKGFGLAMIFDLLCGPLTGAGWSSGVAGLGLPEHRRAQDVGHLFMALDVGRFRPLAAFLDEVDRYIDIVHTTPRAPGTERLYVPGEIEFERADERRKRGIPVDPHVVTALGTLARRFHLDPIA